MFKITLPAGMDENWQDTPSALVVAHPGHQTRVHGWLELSRPRVFILTDGSGHSRRPGLEATTEYLERFGGEPGSIYGQYTDRALYQRIFDRDFDFFNGVLDSLAESLSELRVGFVAGDAAEGYNSIHDICRLLTDAAVEMLSRDGRAVASFDFPVINWPDDCPEELLDQSVRLCLDDQTFARKLEAADAYYPELLDEVRAALGGRPGPMKDYLNFTDKVGGADLEAFRVECLRPANAVRADCGGAAKPFYELRGEKQVAAGLYEHVIRYREHIAPIAERLWRHAT